MTVPCRATANLYFQALNLRGVGIPDSEGVDSEAGIELITDFLARNRVALQTDEQLGTFS